MFYSNGAYSLFKVDTPVISGGATPPSFQDIYSYQFDGVDDYVNIGTSSLGITSAISVSAWVKIPTTNTGGGGTNIQVIACEDTTSGGQRNWNMFWRGMGSNYFAWVIHHTNLSISSVTTTGITPNDGQWHHILATYDGTTNANGIKLYVDGVLNVQGTAGSTGLNAFSSTESTIGATTGGGAWRFEGNIDEVAVWNSDRNADASTIYNGGVPNNLNDLSTPPLSWWRMGESANWDGSNWTLTDQGSGGNDATSQNMAEASRVLDVPPNPWTNTKSILLDGVDDYVDCGNPTSLQITNTITLSAWVKMSSTSGQSQDCIISKDNGSTQRSYTLWGKTSFSSSPIAYIWNGASNYSVQATTNIEDDQWHHVMLVYVPSTSLSIYVDGTLENTNTTSIPSSINNAIQNFHIGQFGNGTFELNGNIDEVALWNSDQSANASTIYNSGVPNDISSLSPLSWWRCGDGDTSPTLTDNGSGGNDGTMTNFSTFSTDVPT
jgi:hypothetical protein